MIPDGKRLTPIPGKRLIKSPKMYFIDSSIAAFLTRQGNPGSLFDGPQGGAFFEGFIIMETCKIITSGNINAGLFFWRSHDGVEVDMIIDFHGKLLAVKIKKTSTPSTRHAEPLIKFTAIAGNDNIAGKILVCTADKDTVVAEGVRIMNWKSYLKFIEGFLKN